MPSTEVDSSAGSRPGGRSSKVRRKVIDAIKTALQEGDFESLSIEAIAGMAGGNKTTVYRRWLNKQGLVADLLDDIANAYPAPPDTGGIAGDLIAVARYLNSTFRTSFGRSLIATIVSSSDPVLVDATHRYWNRQFNGVGRIVSRAIRRGELDPDTNPSEVVESTLAPIYLRALITREDLDPEGIERLVTIAISPHLVKDTEKANREDAR